MFCLLTFHCVLTPQLTTNGEVFYHGMFCLLLFHCFSIPQITTNGTVFYHSMLCLLTFHCLSIPQITPKNVTSSHHSMFCLLAFHCLLIPQLTCQIHWNMHNYWCTKLFPQITKHFEIMAGKQWPSLIGYSLLMCSDALRFTFHALV